MRAVLPAAAIAIAVAASAFADDDAKRAPAKDRRLLQRAPRRRRRSAARLDAVATHGLSDGARRAGPSGRQPHLARRRQDGREGRRRPRRTEQARARSRRASPSSASSPARTTASSWTPAPRAAIRRSASCTSCAQPGAAPRQAGRRHHAGDAGRRCSPPRAVRSTGSSPTCTSRRQFGPTPSRTPGR